MNCPGCELPRWPVDVGFLAVNLEDGIAWVEERYREDLPTFGREIAGSLAFDPLRVTVEAILLDLSPACWRCHEATIGFLVHLKLNGVAS